MKQHSPHFSLAQKNQLYFSSQEEHERNHDDYESDEYLHLGTESLDEVLGTDNDKKRQNTNQSRVIAKELRKHDMDMKSTRLVSYKTHESDILEENAEHQGDKSVELFTKTVDLQHKSQAHNDSSTLPTMFSCHDAGGDTSIFVVNPHDVDNMNSPFLYSGEEESESDTDEDIYSSDEISTNSVVLLNISSKEIPRIEVDMAANGFNAKNRQGEHSNAVQQTNKALRNAIGSDYIDFEEKPPNLCCILTQDFVNMFRTVVKMVDICVDISLYYVIPVASRSRRRIPHQIPISKSMLGSISPQMPTEEGISFCVSNDSEYGINTENGFEAKTGDSRIP